MVDAGSTQLPLGWQGISTAIAAFINAKNRRYANEHDSHPNHRYPLRRLLGCILKGNTNLHAAPMVV
jgi:hypothetical protein